VVDLRAAHREQLNYLPGVVRQSINLGPQQRAHGCGYRLRLLRSQRHRPSYRYSAPVPMNDPTRGVDEQRHAPDRATSMSCGSASRSSRPGTM
jgi:hypothetical protein